MSERTTATATAPATIANCAVGFDVLGHSIDGPRDTVTVHHNHSGKVRVVAIRNCTRLLPTDAERNTAGRALLALREHFAADSGFDIEIDKGIALSSGLGGSAASAVAAVVAANALRPTPLPIEVLYHCARQGEAAASGAPHGDNVAPSLLGGLVIATQHGDPVSLPVPDWLFVAVAHPHFELETRRSREVLHEPFVLSQFVQQTEHLALALTGLHRGERTLIARGLADVLIEPRRAPLIPAFPAVKAQAMQHGALGASIAGGGPSVFGWFDGREAAERGGAAMAAAFVAAGHACDVLVSAIAGPKATVIA